MPVSVERDVSRRSSSDLPERIAQLIQQVIQLLAKQAIKLFGPAVIGEAFIDKVAIDNHLVHQLFGQPLQPFALNGRPVLAAVNLIHRQPHPLAVGDKRLTQGGPADMSYDAGGDILMGLVAPGTLQVGLLETGVVEQQLHLLELRSGEVARGIDHGHQCRIAVDLLTNEVGEAIQIILWPAIGSVALLAQDELVLML